MAIVEPHDPTLEHLVQVLEALADRSRLLIIRELSSGPLAVGDLVARMPISQATVSTHLAVLRRSGLVRVEVDHNRRIHSLSGDTAQRVIAAIENPHSGVGHNGWP